MYIYVYIPTYVYAYMHAFTSSVKCVCNMYIYPHYICRMYMQTKN